MYGAHVPGVPPRAGACETGRGHRWQHPSEMLAPQPVRSRAGFRARPKAVAWRRAAV